MDYAKAINQQEEALRYHEAKGNYNSVVRVEKTIAMLKRTSPLTAYCDLCGEGFQRKTLADFPRCESCKKETA